MHTEFYKWKVNIEAQTSKSVLDIDSQTMAIENDNDIRKANDEEERYKVRRESNMLSV